MEHLNGHFRAIAEYVIANREMMLPEVKKSIASKARNILIRLNEPVEEPKTKQPTEGDKAPEGEQAQ